MVDRLRAEEFAQYLEGATVLITGAAGFLGSRLAERVAESGATRLVLVDSAEGPLVDLVARGRSGWGSTDAVPVLADIRSPARSIDVVARYRPHIVFHAAAYKHVPLVQANPIEGVATNVLGTKNMVEASRPLSASSGSCCSPATGPICTEICRPEPRPPPRRASRQLSNSKY